MTNDCRHVRGSLQQYLDRALEPPRMHAVEAHLFGCEPCRQEFDSLVGVVEAVRSAHPLYAPSAESRERARLLIESHYRRHTMRRYLAMAAAVLVASLIGWIGLRNAPGGGGGGDAFASFAVDTHVRYSRGSLPLDIQSGEPQKVAGWLTKRLPFHLTLPDYPDEGPAKKYALLGARLTQYREDDVAYLAYQMQGKPISLLIGSSARIAPAGGQLYRAGGLTFYQTTYKGLNTITWVDKGLSYALVSDLKAVGAESCAICHGGEGERQKFAPLKARA